MPDSFNVYQKWLGIPTKDQPPNHYRLLGIEVFESDLDTIAHAADRQMAHVRTFQGGEHAAISQKLLNEIAAARVCLLAVETKTTYDRKLKAKLARKKPLQTAKPLSETKPAPHRAAERVAAAGQPTAFHVETAGKQHSGGRRRGPKQPWLLLIMLSLAGLVVVVLGVLFLLAPGEPEVSQHTLTPLGEEPDGPPTAAPPPPAPLPPAPDHRPDDGPDRPALDSPPATDPGLTVAEVQPDVGIQPAEPDSTEFPPKEGLAVPAPPPSADPPQPVLHTSSRIITSVPVTLWVMNDDDQRTPKVFVGGGRVPQSARFNKRGWTFEFTLNPSDVVVVETSDRGRGTLTYVLVDEQGTLLAYSKEAVAVHDGGEGADVFRGGDVSGAAMARVQGSPNIRAMQSQPGFPENIADDWRSVWLPDRDTGTILAHIFTAGPSAAATPAEVAAVEVGAEAGPKLSPPSEAEQQAAEQEIKTVLKDEFAKAKSPDQKLALAQTLLEHARSTGNDPATQFVLLREARDLAVEAGNLASAMRIVDALAGAFEVDALQIKAEVLTEVSRAGRPNSLRLETAAAALDLTEVAAENRRFDLAGQLATLAKSLSMRLSDVELRKRARDTETRIRKLTRRGEEINRARETLATDPDDPDANVTYGTYLCLEEDDWERGLAMLSQGNDPALQAAARSDLATPDELDSQVAAGDTWYELVQADESLALFHVRARHWYAQALPGATALTKAKIEKRLAELGGSPPIATAPAPPPRTGGGTQPKTTLVSKTKDAAAKQAAAAAINMSLPYGDRTKALQYLSDNYPADLEVVPLMKAKAAQAAANYPERTVAVKYLCEHCGDDAEVVRFMKQKVLSRTSHRYEREAAVKFLCQKHPQDKEVFGIMKTIAAQQTSGTQGWPHYYERQAAIKYLCKHHPRDDDVFRIMKTVTAAQWPHYSERQAAIAYLCQKHPEDAEVLQLMKAKVMHEWAHCHERRAAISFLAKKHPNDPDVAALMQEVANDPDRHPDEVKPAQAYLRGR